MIQKNDFIEIDYTGWTKEDNIVFDTTMEKEARQASIHDEKTSYNPVKICIGQGQTLSGIESNLEGKEEGKEYEFELSTDEAFGRKDPKKVQLISTAKFKKANIRPVPGLQVNIDDQIGVIKTVSGGRTLVDFNHPLSGKEVVYKVIVKRKIEDKAEKVSSILSAMLQIEEPEVTMEGEKAIVKLVFDMPTEVTSQLTGKIVEITGVKEIEFKKKEEKAEEKNSEEATDNNKESEETKGNE